MSQCRRLKDFDLVQLDIEAPNLKPDRCDGFDTPLPMYYNGKNMDINSDFNVQTNSQIRTEKKSQVKGSKSKFSELKTSNKNTH